MASRYFALAPPQIEEDKLGHDAGVGAVALHYLREYPEEAQWWKGEDLMAHTRVDEYGLRKKLPDAFIVDARQHVLKVIELATASYDSVRIRAFIEDCECRELAWEIWG